MSKESDKFFDTEIRAIVTDSKAIVRLSAEELVDEVKRQIRRNFNNPSAAFSRGITIDEFDQAIYVRLSPILSSHAQSKSIKGDPNLWILLPDGKRLGFKRIGTGGFTWDALRRRYRSQLSFVPVGNGHVVLYRDRGGTFPIYKIQAQVQTKQRIEFYEKAEEIARKYDLQTENNPDIDSNRGIGFK